MPAAIEVVGSQGRSSVCNPDTMEESGANGRVDGSLRFGSTPAYTHTVRPVAARPTANACAVANLVAVILPPIFTTCGPNLVLMSYVR